MAFVLGGLVGAVALFYVIAPIVVRRTFWFSAHPGPHFVRPWQLDEAVAATLVDRGDQIEALGFTQLAHATVPDSMPDTTIHHRVLADGGKTIVGAVTVVTAPGRAPSAVTTFGSRAPAADGRWHEVSTTDSTEYLAIRPEGDLVTQRPGASAAELLAVHREVLAARPSTDWIRIGSPVDAMREDLERVAEHGLAAGLFVPDADVPGRQRLSLQGAYRMVWANMPPMTWVRRRR